LTAATATTSPKLDAVVLEDDVEVRLGQQ